MSIAPRGDGKPSTYAAHRDRESPWTSVDYATNLLRPQFVWGLLGSNRAKPVSEHGVFGASQLATTGASHVCVADVEVPSETVVCAGQKKARRDAS